MLAVYDPDSTANIVFLCHQCAFSRAEWAGSEDSEISHWLATESNSSVTVGWSDEAEWEYIGQPCARCGQVDGK